MAYYRHAAESTRCEMTFSIFLPPQSGPRPVLWWLSGLTCSAENFTTKAGAYGRAAELGLIIIAPDTSPRGEDVPDDAAYDLGQGAGFYVDATQAPWSTNFQMESYITQELYALAEASFPVAADSQGIAGHSMGGHGALTLGLRHRDLYRSVSAFAPIVAPTQVPWGQKAFAAYLGDDRRLWSNYDATELMRAAGDRTGEPEILIDQGAADDFLEAQLRPHRFVAACGAVQQGIRLREHTGYDHSYFFVASFIDDHLDHHARILASD